MNLLILLMNRLLTAVLLCAFSAVSLAQSMFIVAVQQQNVQQFLTKFQSIYDPDSPSYGQYMTKQQVRDMLVNRENSTNVANWLKSQGYMCLNYGDNLKCLGSVPSSYPPDIQAAIVVGEGPGGMKGVFPRYPARKMRKNLNSDVDDRYTAREVVERLFNASFDNSGHHRVTTCAVEYLDSTGYSEDDFHGSELGNSQLLANVSLSVGSSYVADPETALDLQQISYYNDTSVCYWESDGWLLSWSVEFFNHPFSHAGMITSHSYGWDWQAQDDVSNLFPGNSTSFTQRVNIEFAKLGAIGVTVIVASGDDGGQGRKYQGCDLANALNPDFPASSPYVLSVGGTALLMNNATINYTSPVCQNNACTTGTQHRPSNYADVQWITGGNIGPFPALDFTLPTLQSYLTSGTPLPTRNFTGLRGYPDISAVSHSCATWLMGSLTPIDGTSCASPQMASLLSYVNQHQLDHMRPPLGFVTPLLYKAYAEDPSIFTDIVTGNNYCSESSCCPTRPDGGSEFGFLATVGWDPASGLGTLNLGRFIEWLDQRYE